MRLRFVSAAGASSFMHELLGVVAYEVSELGIETTLSEGGYPPPEPDDVYVVVPHEYFIAAPVASHPSEAQRRRTIAFCVEHPGNVTFERTAQWASTLGRAVDINDDSTLALRSRGVPAERFTLGYSRALDRWGGRPGERDVDVVYLGTTDARRSQALTSYAERLAPRSVQLLVPPHEWMTHTRPDFLMGREKLALLARSKILVNLHRGDSYALEWVRIVEAISNGCAVVSEHSVDFAPLVPGEHIVFGHWRNLALLADVLLEDPAALADLRTRAYEFLRDEQPMRPSAARLVDLAEDLLTKTTHDARPLRPVAPVQPLVADVLIRGAPSPDLRPRGEDPPASIADRLRLAHSVMASRDAAPPVRLVARLARGAGSVDALIAPGPGDPSPALTIQSVRRQEARGDVVVRVTSGDPGAPVVDEDTGAEVLSGAGTVGASRNRLLSQSDAEFALVLEPGDVLLPGGLDRLVRALQDHPDAAVAYPMVAEPDGQLGNALPFERTRLERERYLGAAALWRRMVLLELGGWYGGGDLEPLHDHDLWRRLAATGGSAHLLPQILVRRHGPAIDILRPADLDDGRAARMIDARCEALAG